MVTTMVTAVHRPFYLESWCFMQLARRVTATPMVVHRL
jgi:hypothetical protein